MRYPLWAGLALAALCSQPPAQAGKLRTVWEVDLRKMAGAANGLPEFPIFALRFSPDGRKLAVIADVFGAKEDRKSRVLVASLNHPPEKVEQFEIPFGVSENELGRSAELNFGWAPSGDIVYAVGKVIHLRNRTSCDLPDESVFINDDVALSARPAPSYRPTGTPITLYNQNCEERGKWEVPEIWGIDDVSPVRDLISVVRDIIAEQRQERLIVDPLGRKVLQRWPGGPIGDWEFADSGRAVCAGGAVLESNRAPATCRDVDTGRVIRQTRTNGVEPIAAAAHATRVVVSDYRRRKILFDYEYRTVFKGRYVWDFGSGQELARWYPESETYPDVFSPSKQITEPFRFALSPDGQYVAEGGNGKLRLYRIEP
jgi:hypothetical protein